ncbi:MAG: 4Fe-4S dicluster domain-containing protein [Planctomycetota bacterium]
MADIKIDSKRCKGCCLCVAECPRGNIRMSRLFNEAGQHYAEIIDADNCTGCALCCQMCPEVAIKIRDSAKTGGVIKEITRKTKTPPPARVSGKRK